MRPIAENNGIRVKAYLGTAAVLPAFNLEPNKRKNILDFTISREILSGRGTGLYQLVAGYP